MSVTVTLLNHDQVVANYKAENGSFTQSDANNTISNDYRYHLTQRNGNVPEDQVSLERRRVAVQHVGSCMRQNTVLENKQTKGLHEQAFRYLEKKYEVER